MFTLTYNDGKTEEVFEDCIAYQVLTKDNIKMSAYEWFGIEPTEEEMEKIIAKIKSLTDFPTSDELYEIIDVNTDEIRG